MPHALSYQEPSLVHLLVLASFLYLLNVARVIADHLLYAGIIAEMAFGIIYGSPLANLLPTEWAATFTALGYLGLILVVFEGGLSTNLPALLSNLPISIVCAMTGIAIPIALSFALLSAGFGYEPLQAFAAGAALSSTSLGTTLAALGTVTKNIDAIDKSSTVGSSTPSLVRGSSTSGASQNDINPSMPSVPHQVPLRQSRIGTILVSAAIIDDVVGLVIASLIPALASINSDAPGHNHGHLAWMIVRPLLSSFFIAALAAIVSRLVLRPLFRYRGIGERWCTPAREGKPWGAFALRKKGSGWGTSAHADAVKLCIIVLMVSGMVAIANYTDTSVLYGAYIAGLLLTYISRPSSGEDSGDRVNELSFEETFNRTIGPVQGTLLLPLFFSSIGFAIPFLDLWDPVVIWRGLVYAVLMCLAKLAVGLPILLYPMFLTFARTASKKLRSFFPRLRTTTSLSLRAVMARFTRGGPPPPTLATLPHTSIHHTSGHDEKEDSSPGVPRSFIVPEELTLGQTSIASFPAAIFMGVAMVSRGEIGLLIAQLARGDSAQGEPGLLGDEAFLVCMWAILLCTLVGPIGTGVVVRRWGSKLTSAPWA